MVPLHFMPSHYARNKARISLQTNKNIKSEGIPRVGSIGVSTLIKTQATFADLDLLLQTTIIQHLIRALLTASGAGGGGFRFRVGSLFSWPPGSA